MNLTPYSQEFLDLPNMIYPDMTDDYWAGLKKFIEKAAHISDGYYDKAMGMVYAGILPIGSQGCTYLHGLLLNGKYAGKVVNLDVENQKPHFTFENDFLDWYERWLDEIISGDLLADKSAWFGYVMGGAEHELLEKYMNSSINSYKLDCLEGLLNKAKLSPDIYQAVEKECFHSYEPLSFVALKIVTKNDYWRAKNILAQTYKKAPLQVFQCVYWYARKSAEDWVEQIQDTLSKNDIDVELFRFATYLASECKTDLSEWVAPFMENDNKEIQSRAKYTIEELKRRSE